MNDCLEFGKVIEPIADLTSAVFADKAYDTAKIFEYCMIITFLQGFLSN